MNSKFFAVLSLMVATLTSFAQETSVLVSNDQANTTTAVFEENVGLSITFHIENQHPGQAFLIPSATPTDNWLFIYHDRWGLSADVKQDAYALWKDLKNVNVLAVDLYDGKVACNSGQAMRYLMASEYDRSISIIKGAIAYVGGDAKIGSLGWSAGGAWSLQTAIYAGDQDVACVVYYGMPEQDVEKLKKIETDVLAIFADRDTWITPGLAQLFHSNMITAGKNLTELNYNGPGEFAKRNSAKYDQKNAQDAYAQVLSYLLPRYK